MYDIKKAKKKKRSFDCGRVHEHRDLRALVNLYVAMVLVVPLTPLAATEMLDSIFHFVN